LLKPLQSPNREKMNRGQAVARERGRGVWEFPEETSIHWKKVYITPNLWEVHYITPDL
jgi:hypothetical protein